MKNANAVADAPEAEKAEVFRVVVNVKALIDDVLKANDDATSNLGNAVHRFLGGIDKVSPAAVQFALDENAKATEDKGRKARISELRAVYQAVQHGLMLMGERKVEGVDKEGKKYEKVERYLKGYLQLVREARALLKEKGILPNGKHKKDPETLLNERKVRFQAQALKDGVKAADLDKAWENEMAKAGVAQETINKIAEDFVNGLIGDGYDFVAIRRILTSARALVTDNVKGATL